MEWWMSAVFFRKVCAALLKNLRGCFDFAILSGPQNFQTQIAAVNTCFPYHGESTQVSGYFILFTRPESKEVIFSNPTPVIQVLC